MDYHLFMARRIVLKNETHETIISHLSSDQYEPTKAYITSTYFRTNSSFLLVNAQFAKLIDRLTVRLKSKFMLIILQFAFRLDCSLHTVKSPLTQIIQAYGTFSKLLSAVNPCHKAVHNVYLRRFKQKKIFSETKLQNPLPQWKKEKKKLISTSVSW